MFYYLNSLYFYSLFGFVLESTVYKIMKSNRHSSIFYGPITMVYGFGIVLLLLVKKHFLDQIHLSSFFKIMITFLVCMVVFTFTEWLGGHILYWLFRVDLWNYTKKAFHFGKYVCLELSFVWGFLGALYLYFVKDFVDKILNLFPKKMTIAFILINLVDTFFVFVNKFFYW